MSGVLPERYDILIRGGDVIDGGGGPRVRADVAVTDDRIVAIGDLGAMVAGAEVDAAGLVVAPGFIDAHTHDDRAVLSGPDMTPKISQGVTTVVIGNCGVSLSPLALVGDPPPPMNLLGGREWYRYPTAAGYVAALDADPAAVNVAMLTGHSTLRAGVMDRLDRAATDDEIARMAGLLDEALDAGAVGFSTGLAYPTAIDAPASEVIALAERLERVGGVYTTHMRDEGDHVVDAIEETVSTSRQAGVRVVISHHKCSGPRNYGPHQGDPGVDRGGPAQPDRRPGCLSLRGQFDRAAAQFHGRLPAHPGDLVGKPSGPGRPPISTTYAPNGTARVKRRPSAWIRPARSISRWTRTICSASWRSPTP